jgi:DNA polymerase-1
MAVEMNDKTEGTAFYLIDGSSYFYRAFYALPPLSTPQGLPTNAIYGFITMLLKVMREKKPDYLAIAFDTAAPTHRHLEYKDYKAQRPPMPDNLSVQIPYIHKVVEAMQIPVLQEDGLEADDLIGTVAKKAEAEGLEVTLVTGDKDMFQLVSPHIRIYDTMKEKVYREEEIRARFGVGPSQMIEIMGLMGDTSDNIPGVPGIGEKTAVKLIGEFGDLERLLSRLDDVKQPKLRENLSKFSDQARLSRRLATIRMDCPIDFRLSDYHLREPEMAKLIPLFKELGFESLAKTLGSDASQTRQTSADQSPRSAGVTVIKDKADFSSLVERLKSATSVALVFYLPADEPGAAAAGRPLRGLALAATEQEAYYIPLDQYSSSLTEEKVLAALKPILENPLIKKYGHDLKRAFVIFKRRGVLLRPISFDTMIASYLLNPLRRNHGIDIIAPEYLQQALPPAPQALPPPLKQPGLLDRQGQSEIPTDQAATYFGTMSRLIFQLAGSLEDRLAGQSLQTLYHDIEVPLIEVLAEMEMDGCKIDRGALEAVSKELDQKLQEMKSRIFVLAGGEFNLLSPKQLSVVLFDRLGLKPIRKTKTGYSTDEDVLEQLALQHELPAEIVNFRQLSKLKSTYADALPLAIDPATGRIHTTFHQTIAATGRLSSSDPNLQNIPIQTDWGSRIRSAFVAERGRLLLSADYNQIELRILAHLSQDPELLSAFAQDVDVHTRTAMGLFGLSKEQITADMRRAAKTVNFGVIYGLSPYGLSTTLGISQSEAKKYIDNYFSVYAGVKRFIDQTLEAAKKAGYVTTLFNRRRPLPELQAANGAMRSAGERIAINMPIQGTAADLIKSAMIKIAHRLKTEGHQAKMILQIHDELLFEVPEEEADAVSALVKQEMENVIALSVPITVDARIGKNWMEAHR